MRACHVLLALLGLALLPALPASARDRSDASRVEMHKAVDVAATLLAAQEQGDADAFAAALAPSRPEPFLVLVQAALQAPDAKSRAALLTRIAAEYAKRPATRGAARWAEHWAAATNDDLQAERARVERFLTMPGGSHADIVQQLADVEAPLAYSVGQGLLVRAKFRSLRASVEDGLKLATALATFAHENEWHYMAADAHMGRAGYLTAMRRRREAVTAYREVGNAGARGGFQRVATTALQFENVVLGRLGSVERYAVALKLAEIGREQATETQALQSQLWLANAELHFGSVTAAEERLRKLVSRALELRDEDSARMAREMILQVLIRRGAFADALSLANDLLGELSAAPASRRRTLIVAASAFNALGFKGRAADLCRRAIEALNPEPGKPMTVSHANDALRLAALLRERGDPKAEAVIERMAAGFREANLTFLLGRALHVQAEIAADAGAFDRARALAQEVTTCWQRASPRYQQAAILLRGRVELRAGKPEAALQHLEGAWSRAQRMEPEPLFRGQLMALIGEAHARRKAFDVALPYLRGATDVLARTAMGLGDRRGLRTRDRVDTIARRGFEAAVAQGKLADAWWYREAGHALLLADTIQNAGPAARDRAPVDLRVEEEQALRRLTTSQTALVLLQARGETDAKVLANARAAVAKAHEQVDDVSDRVDRAARKGVALRRGRPVSLAAFQASLAVDEAALAYFVAGERLWGLGIGRSDVVANDLGAVADVRRDVAAWRDLVSTPDGPHATLGRRLHDRLVAPFAALLSERVRKLRVLPDDVVAYVPLEALIRDVVEGRPAYLLERFHRVVYAPSAAVEASLAELVASRPTGQGLLALGDPRYPDSQTSPVLAFRERAGRLDRLPASADEVRRIAALYPESARQVLLGPAASLDRWHRAIHERKGRAWRAVHLACHGFVDTERPRLSGLVFSDGQVLNVERIHMLHNPADLVVLSACNTGGGALHRGEGVLGLTRGFLQAGTPRVVVSNWRVADRSTAELMTRFHAAIQRDGLPAGTALVRAKRELVASGSGFGHPYYWAPFVLWGLAQR